MSPFLTLSRADLLRLADALERRRLAPPYADAVVSRHVCAAAVVDIARELRRRDEASARPENLAYALRLLADERAETQAVADRVDLVWSGPELPGAASRDTATVVRELFASAKRSVLISTYSLDQGTKAETLFGALAKRMDAEPELQVQVFVNVQRPYGSTEPEDKLLAAFASTFRHQIWPGERLPEVYYDPRALEPGHGPRACLHAKVVVVDGERMLITSANFSEAAHARNIEAGLVVDDEVLAKATVSQYETLVGAGVLVAVPGL